MPRGGRARLPDGRLFFSDVIEQMALSARFVAYAKKDERGTPRHEMESAHASRMKTGQELAHLFEGAHVRAMGMRHVLSVLVPLAFFACGATPPPAPSAAMAKRPPPSAAEAAVPTNVLRRAAVHEAIAKGLGAFLQHVSVDDNPVFFGGKFHGFRIASLNDASFWRGVDLKPGDVVTRVNGFPIERPEQAVEAFRSLDVASELRVDYEREGVPRELRFTISDG